MGAFSCGDKSTVSMPLTKEMERHIELLQMSSFEDAVSETKNHVKLW